MGHELIKRRNHLRNEKGAPEMSLPQESEKEEKSMLGDHMTAEGKAIKAARRLRLGPGKASVLVRLKVSPHLRPPKARERLSGGGRRRHEKCGNSILPR